MAVSGQAAFLSLSDDPLIIARHFFSCSLQRAAPGALLSRGGGPGTIVLTALSAGVRKKGIRLKKGSARRDESSTSAPPACDCVFSHRRAFERRGAASVFPL